MQARAGAAEYILRADPRRVMALPQAILHVNGLFASFEWPLAFNRLFKRFLAALLPAQHQSRSLVNILVSNHRRPSSFVIFLRFL